MMRLMLLSLTIAACAGAAVVVTGQRTRPHTAMLDAARAFLATLDAGQKAKLMFAFNSEERFNWFYTPVTRKGLPLLEMSPGQQKAALELLHAGLSEKGHTKSETIRKLEEVLRELENDTVGRRHPEKYYFTFFGEPAEQGTWGWRYEGHHISHHWTIVNGQSVASSPQFFGANPAEVRQGPMKGTRALAAEEDMGRALVKSLSEAQRAEAILSPTAPNDILSTNKRQIDILEDRGIAYSKLNKEQQGNLLALIEEYASAMPRALARERLEKLRKAGLEKVKFAWMGGLEKGQGHYYRIQGTTFLIEYDDTQNNANHVHCVWRDFKGDWGLDLLAEHYRNSPHHAHDSADERRARETE
jgi:hypothetical protein